MTDRPVLVLNAGSSSLKYQVIRPDPGESLLGGHLERLGPSDHARALGQVVDELSSAGIGRHALAAVGHRVVHGGARFTTATLVDDDVLAGLEELVPMAPLHNPPAIDGVRAALRAFPGLPQVAVFDTAFFADLPPAAATYAIDADLAHRHSVSAASTWPTWTTCSATGRACSACAGSRTSAT